MDKNKNTKSRSPVVVVMGHIDHGKSTLLDYIRKANSAEKEAGGITQHLSAYEAEYESGGEKRKITFLDTPGHEAFSTVRERGTQVADIAILVVSAEDGVKPQTLEALAWIKKDKVPFIVALNKIDKPGANIDKVKQSLAEHEILVEGWGGSVPAVPISAKTGEGVPELLEIISLQSDLEELEGDPTIDAEGFVIESDLNPRQGISATLIIKNGTLKLGMFVATEGAFVPVRTITNYAGANLVEASFSSPVKLVGWNNQPSVGHEFKTFAKKEEAINFSNQVSKNGSESVKEAEDGRPYVGVVLKADTVGSLDAVQHELQKLSNEKIAVRIISKGIGAIGEKDVKMANLKKSLVIGFNVVSDKGADVLALRNNTDLKTFKIIYDLVDYAAAKVRAETPVQMVETIIGSAKIIRTFSANKDKQVIGGRVTEGEIKAGGVVKIFRREAQIGEGKIRELQMQKIKAPKAIAGEDFGMMIESKIGIVEGDVIKATAMVAEE